MKESQRAYYRGHRELARSVLADGVLVDGVDREVIADGIDPTVIEAYTLNEAGQALGKTLLTLRTWVVNGILPRCVLKDTTFGYQQFSRGELDVIAEIVAEHEQQYAYLRKNHVTTIERLWSALATYRETYI